MVWHIHGRVRGGRLLIDEPTDLPEGADVQLAAVDLGDDLDREESARLKLALTEAAGELARGEGIPAEQVLAELRARSA
ncbi:MAG: hypothetical protein EPO40_24065 [Myxococcaceae bacterium]|nr:MAG: hypothetical protein EPO40_24065 [Myxococcaceae bacterium]